MTLLDTLGVAEAEVAAVLDGLAARGETVATAESLTAGLLCAALTSVPGASAVVRGGLVVYATELKTVLADVDADLLAEHGAVHPEVAAQLAAGAARRCGADYGVGLTGVAGPDPQDGIAPGVFHTAVCHRGDISVRSHQAEGDRADVRAAAVQAAVTQLAGML